MQIWLKSVQWFSSYRANEGETYEQTDGWSDGWTDKQKLKNMKWNKKYYMEKQEVD